MNHKKQLLQCTLRIEQHVRRLSLREAACCPQCRMAAAPTGDLPGAATPKPPAGEYLSQPAAAEFLERCEKQVYRYRVQGRLPFSYDDRGCIRYAKSDLEAFFTKLHGFPKGGFKR